MSVPSTSPSLRNVRDDLDLSGNFNVRNARGMDRLQKFSGNISLSEYAGTCNSILRTGPLQDGSNSTYSGNRSMPSFWLENAPSNWVCQPEGNGWRLSARARSGVGYDQWVETRFYGRVSESGTYRFRCTFANETTQALWSRFGQINVISFSANYGSGISAVNYSKSDMRTGTLNENTTFSLSTSQPYVVIYLYVVLKGGGTDGTHSATITNCSLKRA